MGYFCFVKFYLRQWWSNSDLDTEPSLLLFIIWCHYCWKGNGKAKNLGIGILLQDNVKSDGLIFSSNIDFLGDELNASEFEHNWA